ncbi:hypothetical protein Tsubulata_000816 [Turnera subulata]|uniref:CHHC U11-48K-type domain-containing protein n=1 Tax=Turnera subulata TaxID=218843 RepID=A0A9Q0JM84_9ROSI|nr:hypothetical protein Tsubulata_000816 [Turnera subulata]
MFPSTPYPNPHHHHHPSFPYRHPPPPPPPPPPNPNFYPLPRPPPQQPPPQNLPPPPPPTTNTSSSIPDLSTTLSSLTHLLSLSDQTLSSPQTALLKPQNPDFISCPYNPHHLMPPHSLFLHSLHCPSLLLDNPSSLIGSLHYPNTLHPAKDPILNTLHHHHPTQDPPTTDLCLSLEHYYTEFSSHFFYRDCPGVVNVIDLDSSRKTSTIPGVVSKECADFVAGGGDEGDVKDFDASGFWVLASGLLAIRREIEGWSDYPRTCSYSIFCAILRLNVIKLSDLRRWIIANSPRYGVVIDVYMTDHVSVLFRLALKAIRKEAMRLMGCKENAKALSFECPVLNQVLLWIASQLSVLYGEMDAKYFSIHILKQCVLDASKGILFSPLLLESEANESDIKDVTDQKKYEEPTDGSEVCNEGKRADEILDGDAIFVSQVAAAVAALHERSLLETKIKGLRVSQLPPRYMRMAEHAFVSKSAKEERKKRPSYKAIIEHDGVPRKRSSNEDTSKTKTREELLAEERDYKRRRMSYRGKKLKRTPLQVLRDIIDQYTEEIKQAGGIGIFEKTEDEGTSPKPSSIPDSSMRVHKPGKGNSESSEVIMNAADENTKQSRYDHNIGSTGWKVDLSQEYEKQVKGHHGRHEPQEHWRSTSRDRHDRDNHSRYSRRHKSHEWTHKHTADRKEQEEVTRSEERGKKSSSKSSYHDYKSSSFMPDSAINIRKDNKKLDARDSRSRHSHWNHTSKSLPQDSFEDRYDPTEYNDIYEDRYDPTKCHDICEDNV